MMFKFFIQKSTLCIYSITFLSLWTINYFVVKFINNNYTNRQNQYAALNNQLSNELIQKQNNQLINIQEFKDQQEASLKLDIEQLNIRANRIINNMNNLSNNKDSAYAAKKEECTKQLIDLIEKILNK